VGCFSHVPYINVDPQRHQHGLVTIDGHLEAVAQPYGRVDKFGGHLVVTICLPAARSAPCRLSPNGRQVVAESLHPPHVIAATCSWSPGGGIGKAARHAKSDGCSSLASRNRRRSARFLFYSFRVGCCAEPDTARRRPVVKRVTALARSTAGWEWDIR
jgi:hypothetical protein